jgi:hypothetical protein
MADILFCLFYIVLFSVIILRRNWFNAGGFGNRHFLGVFYLKLLFGVVLWYIYTHIYKNRLTSDVFKYYDDARIMVGALHTNVKDYLTLLTGIGDSGIRYQNIYHCMNSWENGYGTTLYSNSHFIIRMNAIFWLFSRGHYGVHVIFMCFISFIGLIYIYKAFLPFLQDKRKMLFASIFLFPSVILWSSGVLKEGFIWLGMGISIYYFLQLFAGNNKPERAVNRIYYISYIIIGFVILFESKAYVLLCIFPCFIALFLIHKLRYCKAHPGITFVTVLLCYMASSFLPHIFLQKESPLEMIWTKQVDFNRLSRGGIYLTKIKDTAEYVHIPVTDSLNIIPLTPLGDSLLYKRGVQFLTENPFWYNEFRTNHYVPFMFKKGAQLDTFRVGGKDTVRIIANDSTAYSVYLYSEPAKSSVYIDPIKPTLTSILKNILQALKISVLMPYPWKIHSAMTAIYCAENIFIVMLFFSALFFIRRPFLYKEMALFCLIYCLMILVLIGLVTPILGGIERYKSVVIPFMFILLLLITDKDKMVKAFKINKQ